ncbi:hypothetical protein QWY85_08390 [Neolewinella lacunae]|uniref:Uncharacterized protein n=1 Tax=Neolewinella lacunae TaxID=1517758 RepID=A0A923TCR0_9BACT|nr:hypothetical protein [Neolewinella lacunae]MBC6994002.1 hypothetical protein [Neolewinella lacunae]MDN3634672.1 hypothetical protein [Neolewinella lacunae]
MKRDIITPEVEDVIVAAVPRNGNVEEVLWDIYLVNLRDDPMENVLITSQGHGILDGRDKTTTVLRHFHQQLPAYTAIRVEPIQSELFGIQNEYWISFNDADTLLDKRFIFKAGAISAEALEAVPVLNSPGVMLR